VRLVDVPAYAGADFGLFEELHGFTSAQAFADAIKEAAATHYGHTARLFIEAFINNREVTLFLNIKHRLVQIFMLGAWNVSRILSVKKRELV
jgi:hypothetical protein